MVFLAVKTDIPAKTGDTAGEDDLKSKENRKAAARERERVRQDTNRRRAERKQMNEEYAEKLRTRIKEQEARIEELFREREIERKEHREKDFDSLPDKINEFWRE